MPAISTHSRPLAPPALPCPEAPGARAARCGWWSSSRVLTAGFPRALGRSLLLAVALLGVTATAIAEEPRARVLLQTVLVAGLAHHEAKAVWPDLAVGDALDLVREWDNAHDAQAVRVDWRGRALGYLPRNDNADVARQLDRGQRLEARIVELARYRNHRRKLVVEIFASIPARPGPPAGP